MAQGHQQNLPDPTGGWGDYMRSKRAKLDAQFEAERGQVESQIFKGVAIYVNGWTVPSADELRKIMMKNGGTYHMYKSRRVTHVVVTTLPHSKIEQLKLGEKVVHPDWITDSLKAQKLLPYLHYSHYHLKKFGVASMEKFLIGADPKAVIPGKNLIPKASYPDGRPGEERQETGMLKTTDPNFIKEFYARSRLHHISTSCQEMKAWVRKRKLEHDGVFPSLEKMIKRRGGPDKKISVVLKEKVIMHIDMDCFFVSVGLRNMPHLRGKPVAVTSARYGQPDQAQCSKKEATESWAEIASCSYEARAKGVRNGMLLGRAFQLCPDIVTIPYDFQSYQQVSHALYEIIASYTLQIDAVSCDELFVDFTSVCARTGMTPLYFAGIIRKEVRAKTGCPSSMGIGPNKLIARLATKKAKPDGQFHVKGSDVTTFMKKQPLAELPNVGRMTAEKLEALGVTKCGELETIPMERLIDQFGPKSGRQLLDAAKGRQEAAIGEEKLRKSVSCDINYGIRLHDSRELGIFIKNLSSELSQRLHECCMRGRNLTLKIMVRAADAPILPQKFGGHGKCDTHTRSKTLPFSTDESDKIASEIMTLFTLLDPCIQDLRGIGVTITKLEEFGSKALPTSEEFFGKRNRPLLTSTPKYSDSEAVVNVADYLVALVICHDALKSHQLLRVLHRMIKRSDNATWKTAYSIIYAQVQEAMIDIYQSPLAEVPVEF